MNNAKRIFALILTCAVIFSTLSGAIFTNTLAAPSLDESTYIRIEAEPDAGYSVLSKHFEDPNQASGSASGGKQVGGLSCDHDKIQSVKTLSTYLDASNTANIAFTVRADSPKKYKVMPIYEIGNADEARASYYMTLLVNGRDVYKIPYSNNGSSTVNNGFAEVQLEAGNNVIKMIPVVAETKAFRTTGYINIDCLDVNKDLTPVAPNAHSVKSADLKYQTFDNAANGAVSGDKSNEAKQKGITAGSITKDNLSDVSYIAYTFNVPYNGYYDISLAFQTKANWSKDPYYYAMIVNGVTYVVGAARNTANIQNYRSNFMDLTAKLTAGDNTIVVTNNLAVSDPVNESVTSTSFETLTIYGGAADAAAQVDPLTIDTKIDYTTLSAVDYAAKHVFVLASSNDRLNLAGVAYMPTDNAAAVAKIQSYEELAAGAVLSKSSLPYAAFHVTASQAGKFQIRPSMQIGTSTTSPASKENYFFTVSVNDKRYYKIENVSFANRQNYPLEVELDAGVNVIRLIPYTRESYANAYDIGCTLYSLDVQSTLRGVEADTNIVYASKKATENVTAAAFSNIVDTTASGATGFKAGVIRDQGTAFTSYTPFVEGGRTYENLTQDTLDKLAYIAHTFDVPADGYYDISFDYHTVIAADKTPTATAANKGADGATGYFIARIDGKKVKVPFIEPVAVMQNKLTDEVPAANLSTYLTAGSHTILVSGAMDWKAPGFENDTRFYHGGFLKSIEVSGGITPSATQVNPQHIPDEIDPNAKYDKLEAESFAIISGLETKLGVGSEYSAYGAVAGLKINDTSKLQSFTKLTTAFDKKYMPYAAFSVYAKAAGTYTLNPVYRLTGTTSGYELAVTVNDDASYKSAFVQGGSTGWNASSVQVQLNEGINLIRLIPYTSENADKYSEDCFYLDYLAIDDGNTEEVNAYGVLPGNALTLNTGDAHFTANFGNVSSGLGGTDYNTMKNIGVNVASLNNRNISSTAYFSYTVTAPENGYYDISLPITVGVTSEDTALGKTINGERDFNLAVYVDDAAHLVKFNAIEGTKQEGGQTVGTNRFDGIANASVYLTKGDHALAFTAQMPADGTNSEALYCWTDYTTITLNGGLKLADTYINPDTTNRFEAELYGNSSNFKVVSGKNYAHMSGSAGLGAGAYGNCENLPTRADMEAGKYKTAYPHAIFNIKNDTGSTISNGSLRMRYIANSDANRYIDDFFLYVYVTNANGTKWYKGYSDRWIEGIDWTPGKNEVVVSYIDREMYTQFKEEGGGDVWLDFDYIDVDSALLTADASRAVASKRFEAEDYGDPTMYPGTEASPDFSGGWAISQAQYNYTAFYTEKEYLVGNYVNEPHVSITVEAEKAGYYNMSMGYNKGTGGKMPDEWNTYIIVKGLDGSVKGYKQVNPATWVDNVWLEAGKNEIILTVYDAETHEDTGNAGRTSTWMNIDYLDIHSNDFADLEASGLTYGVRGVMPESSLPADQTKYIRYEAENSAFFNFYNSIRSGGVYSNREARSSQSTENAQTKAELQTNGLDVSKTPHIMYVINAETEGDYEIRVGTTFNATSTAKYVPNGYTGYYGIFVNNTTTPHAIQSFAIPDKRQHVSTHISTVHLKEGQNLIYVTGVTSDTFQQTYVEDQGYTVNRAYIYHDYLDIQYAFDNGNRSISVSAPVNRMEAEDSFMRNYTAEERGGASGGSMACRENYTKVLAENLTLEKLNSNPDYLAYAPYIDYEVIADKAGRYPVIFTGNSGRSESLGVEDMFFGLAIENEKTKANGTYAVFEKVNYKYYGTGTSFSIIHWVEVEEGTNILRLTGNLRELVVADGKVNWTDHDCVVLPKELHGVEAEIVPPGKGDEFMEVSGTPITLNANKTIKPTHVYVVDDDGNVITDYSYRARCYQFDLREDADYFAEQLISEGYKDVSVVLVDDMYVVYVGKYDNLEDAEAMAATLYDNGYESAEARIVTITKIGDNIYGTETSPSTGENILLVLPLLLALAAITGMYAFFKTKKKASC